MKRIFISAAEASSDTHAAALIRALRKLSPVPLEFYGVGGPRSEVEGLEVIVPTRQLLSMGLVEVIGKLPRIAKALRELDRAAEVRKPDLAIVLDYPEFHFKLAARLQRRKIPIVCMIPPKVWVWRQKRVAVIKRLYTHVITILPFEQKFYADWGVAATYVGNPLLDQLPSRSGRAEIRTAQGFSESDKVLLLMPGSRSAELQYHLEPMLLAALELQHKVRATAGKKLRVWIPLAPTEEIAPIEARIRALPAAAELDWRLTRGDAWSAMIAADAGIIKSGTSSLEAAILDLPHVVIYRGHPISEWVFRNVVKYDRPISLVNLIYDYACTRPAVVSELIMHRFTVGEMVAETWPLLSMDGPEAREMREKFKRVRGQLRQSQGSLSSPSDLAARKVMEILGIPIGESDAGDSR